MDLYVFDTGNRHDQYLIFTSRESLLEWAHKATRLTEAQIFNNTSILRKTQFPFYSFFPENK